METITLDFRNYLQTQICCCDGTTEPIKKHWLEKHMQDGVVYRRSADDASFMEYMPGEDAWCPVEARHIMFIHFFYIDQNPTAAKTLMREAIADCRIKGRNGLAAMVCDAPRPFLPEAELLRSFGFDPCDRWGHYQLYYLPLEEGAEPPRFAVNTENLPDAPGFTIYYSDQCPAVSSQIDAILSQVRNAGTPYEILKVDVPRGKEEMDRTDIIRPKDMPHPYTMFAAFLNGQLLTDDIEEGIPPVFKK